MINRKSNMKNRLYESVDSYISILVDEAQFYTNSDDDFFDDEFIKDSPEFRKFKRDCQRLFGRESIKEYGAGQLEIIITESNYKRFVILANQYDIEYEVSDIVEF